MTTAAGAGDSSSRFVKEDGGVLDVEYRRRRWLRCVRATRLWCVVAVYDQRGTHTAAAGE